MNRFGMAGVFSWEVSVDRNDEIFRKQSSRLRERSTYEIHLGQQGQGQGMSGADRGRRGVREVTKGQTLHSLEVIGRNLDFMLRAVGNG